MEDLQSIISDLDLSKVDIEVGNKPIEIAEKEANKQIERCILYTMLLPCRNAEIARKIANEIERFLDQKYDKDQAYTDKLGLNPQTQS